MKRFLLVLLIVCAALAPVSHGTVRAQGGSAAQVIAEVNSYRASLGLAPWTAHLALMAAAQAHVDWMVRTGNRGHTGEGGTTPTQRAKAAGYPGTLIYENWVMGRGMTPTEAMIWWDNSPIHQATLQLPTHEHVGVGVGIDGNAVIYVLMAGKETVSIASTTAGSDGGSEGDSGPSDRPASAVTGDDSDEPPTPVAAVVIPVTRADAQPDGSIIHVVQQGQTAWTIAAVYGVELDYVRQINQLPPNALVRPGDQLLIRLGEGQSPPFAGRYHTIKEGETAWTVAAYYGLTLDEVLDLNGIDRSTIVKPGDVLMIRAPQPTWTPMPTFTPTTRFTPMDVTLAPTFTPTHTPPPSATPTRTPAQVAAAASATPSPEPVPPTEPSGEGGPDMAVLFALVIAGMALLVLIGSVGLALGLSRRG